MISSVPSRQPLAGTEPVGGGDVLRPGAVPPGQGGEGLAARDVCVRKVTRFSGGDRGQAVADGFAACPTGPSPRRCGRPAWPAGAAPGSAPGCLVERASLAHSATSAQVHRALAPATRVERERRLGRDLEAVLLGRLGHHDGGVDHRHVVLGLARQGRASRASSQKSSVPVAVDAARRPGPRPRCRRPGPGSSRSNIVVELLQVRAAARVAFSGLLRSSTHQSCCRPKRRPVAGMNCHTPLALARERRLRLEGALDQGHVGQVLRDALGGEHLADAGQVAPAAGRAPPRTSRAAAPGRGRCRPARRRSGRWAGRCPRRATASSAVRRSLLADAAVADRQVGRPRRSRPARAASR